MPLSVPVRLPDTTYNLIHAPLSEAASHMEEAGLRPGRCLVVTDTHVAAHHLDPLLAALENSGWTPHALRVRPGEASKSQTALRKIYDEALAWGMDRQTPVVALGGGVVGDLAGYAAATLLRGVPLVHMPTTVIAQVDSAIGGKTGINHETGKNLIGAFHQPALVLVDVDTLGTLPSREWASGLAEAFKHALIADASLTTTCLQVNERLMDQDLDVMRDVLPAIQSVKTQIVEADVHEKGQRMLLNFGHTFGHALEQQAGYGTFTHGEAVALGMRAALYLSEHLHPSEDFSAAHDLVRCIPVPGARTIQHLSIDDLMRVMRHDKKAVAGRIRLILLDRIGHAYVTADVHESAIREAWTALMNTAHH